MTQDQIALLLQLALLGEVPPALRGAGFTLSDRHLELTFYFDGSVSEEDRESASCVETEVIAGLPEEVRVASNLVRVDAPDKMPDPGRWAYRRRE